MQSKVEVKQGKNEKETKKKRSLFSRKEKKSSSLEKRIKTTPFTVIDVGSFALKVISGKVTGNQIDVNFLDTYTIHENIVRNGKIIKKEEFKDVLKEILPSNKRIGKDISVTIESPDIIRREVIIPKVSLEDADGLIRYEMKQYLPLDSFAFGIQYRFVEEIVDSGGNEKMKFYVVAMPKEMITEYHSVLTDLRYNPVSLDIQSNCVKKLLELEAKGNPRVTEQNVLLVDMGHSQFNMQFFNKGNFVYNRVSEMGSNQISRKVKESLNIEPQNANRAKIDLLSKVSVFELYQEFTLDLRRRSESFEEIFFKEVISIIEDWTRNLDSVIKFYNTQPYGRHNPVDQILLYGGSSYINDIDTLIQSRLNIPTSRIDNLNVIQGVGNMHNTALYLNAIGGLVNYY